MTVNMMFILQNMFLITVPITTILTTIAMLMPYWWLSDTFQVGLWRARAFSSSWITVEPETDTHEGKNIINHMNLFLNILFSRSSFIYSSNSFIYICIINKFKWFNLVNHTYSS
jgi:hypothetical protein